VTLRTPAGVEELDIIAVRYHALAADALPAAD
jgi:hypothetical protein